ncbi:MAG: glycosyltransferase family 2 protein [Candidatus Curtissbacteria bacterium]|nr:glycosyltransferase family 2 protein [Candidatus Curtissbacteria bacterium]
MSILNRAVIIVPAFNEEAVILKVIQSIPKRIKGLGKIQVLVVDDGSTDNTKILVNKTNVSVASHIMNRGLGAAIKTGLEWARVHNIDLAVTFDGDGQHDPADISRVIKPILDKSADIVIGSRFKKKQRVPLDRLILNWFANLATLFLFGVFSTDSQSGLRAFSKKAIKLIDFKADRMEFSSEILLEAKKHSLKTIEIPIRAIYTAYSRSKGQKNTNAIPVFARHLVRLLR